MDKDAICFVILEGSLCWFQCGRIGLQESEAELVPLAAHGPRAIRIPGWSRRMSMCTELLWPRHYLVAVQDALRYTFGIPRPARFAGLGAHAWRNAETQRKQPSVSSRALRRHDSKSIPANRLDRLLNCF